MSVWTDYDPLKEIIVGVIPKPEYFSNFLKPDILEVLTPIIKETEEDLERFANICTSLGVKVYRPKVMDFKEPLKLPGFKIKNPIAPLVPRDSYLVYGNTIYSSYTSMADRWLESLSFYDIFMEKYKEGYNWISTPVPQLKDFRPDTQWYTHGGDRYGVDLVDKILWHCATMYKCGDALIVNSSGPGTKLGYDWMQRNIPNARFIKNANKPHLGWGHIDQFFFQTDDTTVFCTNKNYVPDVFLNNSKFKVHEFGHLIKDVDMKIYEHRLAQTDGKYSVEWIDEWIDEWRGFAQEVAFDSNVVVVDSKNIIVTNEQPALSNYFKEFGITLHPVNLRQGGFWDGGVHCLSLDIKRDGERRNIV